MSTDFLFFLFFFFLWPTGAERIGFRTPVAISIGRGRSTALDLETTPLPVALGERGEGQVKFNPLSPLLDRIDTHRLRLFHLALLQKFTFLRSGWCIRAATRTNVLELRFKSCYLKRGFWVRGREKERERYIYRERERVEKVRMLNYYYYYFL